MSYKPPLGDPDLLKKRIVSNPRYDGIQPTVECGITAGLAKLIREAEPSVKQKEGELFRRIRASTVGAYLEEKLNEEREREFREQYAHNPDFQRQAQGLSQVPLPPQLDEYRLPVGPKRDYLILDVREREDFDRCHIAGAINYNPIKLAHATNPYTPDILQFKNKENRVIVLYDLDEEIVVGRKVANVFFEKGADNVVIISGGLKEFVQNFSHLIFGESPVPILPKNARVQSRGGTSSYGGSATGSRMGGAQDASRMHSTATSHKPKSLSSSLAKPQTSAFK
jgi:centrosomal protein CEP41